ncbi:hypothetical protein [uncultured Clostridium sp.]|uniref:hypothetical protein n=1 Tax=uncultured Clostridium sp. TaxID=59620 RepID=UPI00262FA678|nr:hypothetical protein [uncultured Clostridium sp.]
MGYEQRLSGEYLETFKEIMIEIDIEEINRFNQEEIRHDILDMFLSAQDDGTSAKEIVGDNPKEFIQDILGSFKKKDSFAFRGGRILSNLILGMGAISLTRIKGGVLEFTIDIVFLAAALIIGEILGIVCSKGYSLGKARRRKKRQIEWSFNIAFIVVSALIVGFLI